MSLSDGDSETESDPFPTSQLLILGKLSSPTPKLKWCAEKLTKPYLIQASCRIAEPIALTSVAPYAYDLLKSLVNDDSKDAAFYAGLFFAAFSFAESLTGVLWGTLSDRIGRKPVLLLGCAGTIVSTLVIGFAQNVWVALIGRALGGALNGNVGVVQTVVAELTKNPKHERGFARCAGPERC